MRNEGRANRNGTCGGGRNLNSIGKHSNNLK